ncbi:hypothetical protein ABK706_04925 [Enterobacter sichuanensis]|uniref:hypothetical protein n=1 Tax=Enterobacter sichuanensis TaxID=2071710 RepID=UPI003751CBD5|nr:hypothetical protein [Enterobacter cloacae]
MVCRKTNIALISIVGALLILAILALIKVLFANVKGFEWGSFTDWLSAFAGIISAFGTVATFWIAYKALKKVPEWMEQKHYDIAYSMIENAIFKDLSSVRSSSFYFRTKIITSAKTLRNSLVHRTSLKSDFISDAFISLDNTLNEFHNSVYNVINQLKAVSRTDYQISEYCLEILQLLQSTHNEYNNVLNRFYSVLSDVETKLVDDVNYLKPMVTELDLIQSESINLNARISDFINEIYLENRPIKDFIIPNRP